MVTFPFSRPMPGERKQIKVNFQCNSCDKSSTGEALTRLLFEDFAAAYIDKSVPDILKPPKGTSTGVML